MSVYNGARYLQEAISSVLRQSFEDFEFIIVDDGSTDKSVDIIERNVDPRIRLIRNKENYGLAASLNIGVKAATGEYIARQDADDVSVVSRFEHQISALRNNHNLALVGGNWSIIDVDGDEVATKYLPVTPFAMRENLVARNIRCPHGSMVFSRSALDAVGGYDTEFYFSQDLELQLRLAAEGYEMSSVSEVIYRYRWLPQQLLAKSVLQGEFRKIANERYRTGDWTLQVPEELGPAARRIGGGSDQTASADLGGYWYALALTSARGFRPITMIRYALNTLKSGNLGIIAKLMVKLPWTVLVSSWATLEGRRTS